MTSGKMVPLLLVVDEGFGAELALVWLVAGVGPLVDFKVVVAAVGFLAVDGVFGVVGWILGVDDCQKLGNWAD